MWSRYGCGVFARFLLVDCLVFVAAGDCLLRVWVVVWCCVGFSGLVLLTCDFGCWWFIAPVGAFNSVVIGFFMICTFLFTF